MPAPPATRATARAPDWRTWLAGSPREILRRTVAGDPLGVRALVARHLREAALLLDGDRVHLRALARCARRAPRYRGRPPIERWLASHVATAAEELARETADPGAPGRASAIHDLARPLGLEPAAMQRACAAFHRLPDADRHAFFALVIDQRSLDEIARAASASASEIARRARRALDTLLEGAVARERHPPPHSIEGGTRDSPRT